MSKSQQFRARRSVLMGSVASVVYNNVIEGMYFILFYFETIIEFYVFV